MMSSIELESTYTDAESFLFIYTASDTSPPPVAHCFTKSGSCVDNHKHRCCKLSKNIEMLDAQPINPQKIHKKAFFVRKIWGGLC